MTLGAALFTRRGGNPLGPAGTGKTETVKDFGKALARYVIVFNCSDGVDFKMTGKMLSGLAQTGAWACLDEFNRIEVEVLSVVATQISTLMRAIKLQQQHFNFMGQEIRLIPTCGVFVTMNPGYAGRSELPDNLKAIVRPVSMMVPDFTLIAEIMMFSEGFSMAKPLAKKMIAIMELSQQQLSKQDHYDYGLRSFVIPIARAAGALKRADPDAPEEIIMYRTMLDLIKPKLVYLDLPLFMALLSDLFPGIELPESDGGELRRAIEAELLSAGLQIVAEYVTKLIQIFDCKVARHGNMIVGRTGAGKTAAWRCLQRAMASLSKSHSQDERYQQVHAHIINPLALSNDEIYGCFDPATHEWRDGILARIMRTICRDESQDQKWVVFDGPGMLSVPMCRQTGNTTVFQHSDHHQRAFAQSPLLESIAR
jgi:dynein heavy chain, axonemal